MKTWKNSFLLISGIGVSNLGNWIYLVAINLLVLQLTGSPAAIAGLFIIRPIAILLTNTWSGSLIDRMNKRKLMIVVDCFRGVLIAVIPFMNSVWSIYGLMFLINVAGSFFGPSSNTYITKLVPAEKRKRFNSIFSFASSGAFLVGPSISGILIMYTSIDVCIFINAISFFVCAGVIFFLPNVDETSNSSKEKVNLRLIVRDWKEVIGFSKVSKYFMIVYLLFQTAMLVGFALDSQEATFIKNVIQLSERDYGFLVSITGIGSLLGSLSASIVSNRLSLRTFLGMGMVLSAAGYVIFYASDSFLQAAIGFLILGIFISFANVGYSTFFQNNIPVKMMGRFGSVANLVEGIIQIIFTLLLGFIAELISLQFICLVFSGLATIISILLVMVIFQPSKIKYFHTELKSKAS